IVAGASGRTAAAPAFLFVPVAHEAASREVSMELITLNDLFLHELQDLYDAEQQLVDALPKLAEAAANPQLRDAFLAHLQETEGHVQRLESIFEACGEKPKRESCKGMAGLIKEGSKLMHEKAGGGGQDARPIPP